MGSVIELAKQAGLCTNLAEMGASSIVYTLGVDGVTVTELERFATLVRNAAMEEAAQLLYAEGDAAYGQDLNPYRLAKEIESLKGPK